MKLIKITLDPATPLYVAEDFTSALEDAFDLGVVIYATTNEGVIGAYGPMTELVEWAAAEMPHVVVTFAEVEV